MTKLKTLLLLVLAGFILVACGSDEEETVEEAVEVEEVVDERAEDKAAMALLIADELPDLMVEVDSISECVAEVFSENLDDDEWTVANLILNKDDDGLEEFMLSGDINEDAIGEALQFAVEAAEIECDVDLD